ncbi:hypothetical protein Tco_0777432 [Tanacetum coccineum]
MGEPLSPNHVFDFPMDEPHPAYDIFAPGTATRADIEVEDQMDAPRWTSRRPGGTIGDDYDTGDEDSEYPTE